VLIKSERVLDSSSCSSSSSSAGCPILITCPSYKIGAVTCYSINGIVKVNKCSAGYYTTASYVLDCSSCSVLSNCL